MTSSNYVPQGYGKTTFSNFYNNSMNLFQGCDFLPNCNGTPCQICHECGNRLCNVCEQYHKQFHKDHATEHLHFSSTATSQSEQVDQSINTCPHNADLDLYCMLCDIKVCQKCATEEHNDHRVVRFDEAVDEAEEFYKKMNIKYLEVSARTEKNIEKMIHFLDLHEEQYAATLEQFSVFVENLKMWLDEKKNAQIAELKSKSEKAKCKMQEQLKYWQTQQEAEKDILIQIQLFNKTGNKLQWQKRRKSMRCLWERIENQSPPPFQYSGIASFVPNNKFMRCIKEETLGNLQIALDKTGETKNGVEPTDRESIVSSGYAEAVELDKKNTDIHVTANDVPVLTYNGTASRCRDYTDFKASSIHKIVLHLEGNLIAFNEGTLDVLVKDEKDTRNNTNAVSIPENGNLVNDVLGNVEDTRRNTNTMSGSKYGSVNNDVELNTEDSRTNTNEVVVSPKLCSKMSFKSESNCYEDIYDRCNEQTIKLQQMFRPLPRPPPLSPPPPPPRPSPPVPPNRSRPPSQQRKAIESTAGIYELD